MSRSRALYNKGKRWDFTFDRKDPEGLSAAYVHGEAIPQGGCSKCNMALPVLSPGFRMLQSAILLQGIIKSEMCNPCNLWFKFDLPFTFSDDMNKLAYWDPGFDWKSFTVRYLAS
jgi:hypothetical protein